MTWKNEYSVNIRQIDIQHKKLVELINDLHEAMSAGKAKDVLEKILGELVAYTKFHFSKEEELMETNGYAGLLAHRIKHKELTEKVLQFQNNFRSGSAALSIELMNFLKSWLVDHIQGTDKQYSAPLNAKGIS